MDALLPLRRGRKIVAIESVDRAGLGACRKRLGARAARWLQATGFTAAAGEIVLLPTADGTLQRVLAGVDRSEPLWALGHLASKLPAGSYVLAAEGVLADARLAALGFALGAYRYTRYKPRGVRRRGWPSTRRCMPNWRRCWRRRRGCATWSTRRPRTWVRSSWPVRYASSRKAHTATVREWVGDDAARGRLSGHPRRRPRQSSRTAADRTALGQPRAPAAGAGRQGRVLRHRRPRPQDRRRHALDEEGHGRRRTRAGAGRLGDAGEPAGTPDPADSGGGKRHRRRCLSPRRGDHHAQRPQRRDRQHRRRGPPDPRATRWPTPASSSRT